MERGFLNVILIYSLASCGFLLAAFFKPRYKPRRYLIVGVWTICLHVAYKLIWACFADEQQYELPIPFGLVYPVLLYLLAHTYYRPDTIIPTRINGAFLLPFLLHVFWFTLTALQYGEEAGAIRYTEIYYASSMLSLLVYTMLTTRLYSIYKGPTAPMDILFGSLRCFAMDC